MNQFIKLTRLYQTREFEIIVNSSHIVWMEDYVKDGVRKSTHIGIKFHDNNMLAVKETKEEIIDKIYGKDKSKPIRASFGWS